MLLFIPHSQHQCRMRSHICNHFTIFHQIFLILCCISVFVRIQQTFHTTFRRNLSLPYRNFHFRTFAAVIDHDDDPVIAFEPCIRQDILFSAKNLQRTGSKCRMLFVDADRFFVKRNQFMVFTSPRIGPSVIRIRESTDARLITIIYGRCSDPCHLHDDRFTHNRFIYIFICSFRSQMFYTTNHVVRSRKESRMIMVRKFVHRYLQ